MKGIILKTKVLIKKSLGLCNTKGCYKKAIGEIKIDCINVKRCLCKKHLDQYKELSKRADMAMDLAKEEDRTVITQVLVSNNEVILVSDNEVKQEKSKNEYEKQLDKLYKLQKRVKKNRVKKKINKRIYKLKGNKNYRKHRRYSSKREG